MSLERAEVWERYTEPLPEPCDFCDGEGEIEVPCPIQPGRFVWVPCEACA